MAAAFDAVCDLMCRFVMQSNNIWKQEQAKRFTFGLATFGAQLIDHTTASLKTWGFLSLSLTVMQYNGNLGEFDLRDQSCRFEAGRYQSYSTGCDKSARLPRQADVQLWHMQRMPADRLLNRLLNSL